MQQKVRNCALHVLLAGTKVLKDKPAVKSALGLVHAKCLGDVLLSFLATEKVVLGSLGKKIKHVIRAP